MIALYLLLSCLVALLIKIIMMKNNLKYKINIKKEKKEKSGTLTAGIVVQRIKYLLVFSFFYYYIMSSLFLLLL